MKNTYTAITKKEGKWWLGWIEEVPGVNCQEETYVELLKSLRITLKEAIGYNKQDAVNIAGDNYRERKIAL